MSVAINHKKIKCQFCIMARTKANAAASATEVVRSTFAAKVCHITIAMPLQSVSPFSHSCTIRVSDESIPISVSPAPRLHRLRGERGARGGWKWARDGCSYGRAVVDLMLFIRWSEEMQALASRDSGIERCVFIRKKCVFCCLTPCSDRPSMHLQRYASIRSRLIC